MRYKKFDEDKLIEEGIFTGSLDFDSCHVLLEVSPGVWLRIWNSEWGGVELFDPNINVEGAANTSEEIEIDGKRYTRWSEEAKRYKDEEERR